MYPFPSPMLMSGGLARYIGQTDRIGDGALTFPAEAVGGDLALVIVATDSAEITGWTKETGGGSIAMIWRRLTSGDVSSPPSISASGGQPVLVLIYRGPLSATKRAQQASITGSTQTISGFVKSAGSKAIVSAYSKAFASSFASGPSGFTLRRDILSNGTVGIGAADILRPLDYTDNADMVWSLSGSAAGGALAIELL